MVWLVGSGVVWLVGSGSGGVVSWEWCGECDYHETMMMSLTNRLNSSDGRAQMLLKQRKTEDLEVTGSIPVSGKRFIGVNPLLSHFFFDIKGYY